MSVAISFLLVGVACICNSISLIICIHNQNNRN